MKNHEFATGATSLGHLGRFFGVSLGIYLGAMPIAYWLGQLKADIPVLDQALAESYDNFVHLLATIAFVSVCLAIIAPGLKTLDQIANSRDGIVSSCVSGLLTCGLLVLAPTLLAGHMPRMMLYAILTNG